MFIKKILTILFTPLLTMLLTTGVLMGTALHAQAVEYPIFGLWKNTQEKNIMEQKAGKSNSHDTYYYFGEKGVFALPEQSVRTGISWEISPDDILTLRSFPVPANSAKKEFSKEEFFKIITLEKTKMILQDTNAKQLNFERIKDTIVHISGKMMYRERMALPPLVETRVKLYADGKPFAISSLQKQGQVPLSFSLYFIAREKDAKITLDASLYHGYNKLFATMKPVPVEAEYITNKKEQKELNVLLHRSESFEDTPKFISTPSIYKSKKGEYTLYLEDEGFGIFQDKKSKMTIHWNQVDRNHNMEILRSGEEPLSVSVQSEDELVFQQLNGEESIVFSSIDGKFSQEILNLTGMYTEMGSKGYFTDCNSQKQFVLDFAQNPELHKAYVNLEKNTGKNIGLANIEALISRNNGKLSLSVKNFKSLDDNKKCEPMFQNAGLTNTYWRLVTLNDKAVEKYQDQTEPHLIIRDNQATGSDACNNFFMPATINGDKLTFGQGGSTLMLCPQGDAQGREFLQTLNIITDWKINGSVLQLTQKDSVKLTFEAVYF